MDLNGRLNAQQDRMRENIIVILNFHYIICMNVYLLHYQNHTYKL